MLSACSWGRPPTGEIITWADVERWNLGAPPVLRLRDALAEVVRSVPEGTVIGVVDPSPDRRTAELRRLWMVALAPTVRFVPATAGRTGQGTSEPRFLLVPTGLPAPAGMTQVGSWRALSLFEVGS